MIATHNIKVNGRWIRAGEFYDEPKKAKEPEKEVPATEKPKEEKPAVETVKAPEKVPEKKQEAAAIQRTPSRRKASK